MTAQIYTHKLRRPWLDSIEHEAWTIARVCDADAQLGVAYRVPGQLWSRIAEGKRRDG